MIADLVERHEKRCHDVLLAKLEVVQGFLGPVACVSILILVLTGCRTAKNHQNHTDNGKYVCEETGEWVVIEEDEISFHVLVPHDGVKFVDFLADGSFIIEKSGKIEIYPSSTFLSGPGRYDWVLENRKLYQLDPNLAGKVLKSYVIE